MNSFDPSVLNLRRLGYDNPIATQEEDVLDRWRYAAEVMNVIKSTPADWSVRVGVLGKWGEGKTTILKFVESMARNEGYITFWFNPWAATTIDHMWGEFTSKLLQSLEDEDIEVAGKNRVKLGLLAARTGQSLRVAQPLSELHSAAKATFGALSAIREILEIHGPELQALRSRLGRLRLLALIDDLDRADPKLLPQLLLALRELLDLPGFSFVLGFDSEIVGDAVAQYHPAWKDGDAFLDKILDFRFPVPGPTAAQLQRLVNKSRAEMCPFVPDSAFNDVGDLLPSNPRKLKALLRSLAVLRSEVERFEADELNWTDVLIAHLMKIESPAFLPRFLEPSVFDEEAGMSYRIRQYERSKSKDQTDHNETVKARLRDWGIKDEKISGRLIRLVEALRSRGGRSFPEQAQLTARPPVITGKEFRLLRDGWHQSQSGATISSWIDAHAQQRSSKREEVADQLLLTSVSFWGSHLERAAETTPGDV